MAGPRLDNEIFLLPDRGRLLTVCFCCECCCVSRFFRHLPVRLLDRFYLPLQGLSVETSDACTGCGACVEQCYIGPRSLWDGRSVRNDRCRGCGRCAAFCPAGAVTVHLRDPGAAEETIRRVESYVDYGQRRNAEALEVVRRLPEVLGLALRTIVDFSNLTSGSSAPSEARRRVEAAFLPMLAAAGLRIAMLDVFNAEAVRTARACEALLSPRVFTWESL